MKTSRASVKSSGRVVVDANPILSAVIGGKARTLFLTADVQEFSTTIFTWNEVLTYLPAMSQKPKMRKAGVPLSDLYATLMALPLVRYEYEFYQEKLNEARRRIARRDPDDAHLLALVLKLKAPVWTNDEDFADSGIEWFTTAEFLKRVF